jgi:hypothetical protein
MNDCNTSEPSVTVRQEKQILKGDNRPDEMIAPIARSAEATNALGAAFSSLFADRPISKRCRFVRRLKNIVDRTLVASMF